MEGDLELDLQKGETPEDDHQEEKDKTSVHFGELEVFDSLGSEDENNEECVQELVERFEKEWVTHYLAASTEHSSARHGDFC